MNENMKSYGKMIFSNIWVLLILGVAAGLLCYFFYGSKYERIYEANEKLIISINTVNSNALSTFDSIRSSQMAVGDICQIITSDMILLNIEKECGINQIELQKALKVNAIPNTRVIDITISVNSPELALKIAESLDANLSEKLKEIDGAVGYKLLSSPHVDYTPVNRAYPIIFTIVAVLGGFLLGALVNIITVEMKANANKLEHFQGLFSEENILPVPATKMSKFKGDIL